MWIEPVPEVQPFVEEAATSGADPKSLWAEHAGEAGTAIVGTSGATIDLRKVPKSLAEESDRALVVRRRSTFLQHQEYDLGQALLSSREVSEVQVPYDEASTGPGVLAAADLVSQFDGIPDSGQIPADTTVAVGPDHVLEAINSGFAIYSKLGREIQGYTTFASFFSGHLPAGFAGTLIDPRVIFDRWHDRYIMLVVGVDDVNQISFFFIAVSQSTDPTGTWSVVRVHQDENAAADANAWLDFCGVAADPLGVYVTCNLSRWSNGSFKHAGLWSFSEELIVGGTWVAWTWRDLRWNNNDLAFALQPALPHSTNANGDMFFVNSYAGSGSTVLLWKLTGARDNAMAAPTVTRSTINVAPYMAIGAVIPQSGSAALIDGGDARIMNAVYAQDRVYAVLTDDTTAIGVGETSGIVTLKLNTASSALEWFNTLRVATGWYLFYPAITIEGGDSTTPNIGVFANFSNAMTLVSVVQKVYNNHPTDGTGPFSIIKTGLGVYDPAGDNLWGDYNGAAYDWTCGNMWGAVEYAGDSNNWATWIRSQTFDDEPLCPLIDVLDPNGGETLTAFLPNTILWDSANLDPSNGSRWVDRWLPQTLRSTGCRTAATRRPRG
jgi:hypothetical protein